MRISFLFLRGGAFLRDAVAAVALCAALSPAFAESAAVTIRNPANARTWQIARADSFKAFWPDGAAEARLVTVDRLRAAAITDQVRTPASGPYAVFDLPADDGRQACYDLTLTFSDSSGATLATKTARVVRLPETADVQVPATKDWEKIKSGEGRLMSYDRAWASSSAAAASAYLSVEGTDVSDTRTLAGTNGWDALTAEGLGTYGKAKLDVGLGFDAEDPIWTSAIRLPFGMVMIFR